MNALPHYNNFELATARDPVAAVLTAGIKRKGGGFVPGSTDRFWLGVASGAKKTDRRALHPAFRAFNAAGTERPEGSVHDAAFIRGNLAHADIRQASRISRVEYRGPTGDPRVINPRHQGPWCIGDGHRATRWNGKAYAEIECPDDACPFANLSESPCKAHLTVLFYPRWDGTPWASQGFPRVLTKYHSGGRRMRDSWKGLVQHAEQFAAGFDIAIQSWIGFPFTMTLGKRPTANGICTDVSFAADGDLFDWLQGQAQRRAALASGSPAGLLAPVENTPEAHAENQDMVDAEIRTVKPANVAEPNGEPPDAEPDSEPWIDLEAAVKAAGIGDEIAPEFGPPGPTWELNRAAIEAAVEKARRTSG